MSEDKTIKQSEEKPILMVIQEIKDGQLIPEMIDKDLRQQCVEVFLAEGYSVPQIAQILKKCDKTIRRDITEIRERNTLSPNIELAKKLIGEIVTYARIHREHLMRMSRTKEASVSEKAQAEYYAHRVEMELVDKLQTLGYLPLKPKTIVGDFNCNMNVNDEKSIVDLKMQLVEIEKLALEQGNFAPELEIEVRRLKKRIEKVEIESDILKITNQNNKEEEHD
jgi:transposase